MRSVFLCAELSVKPIFLRIYAFELNDFVKILCQDFVRSLFLRQGFKSFKRDGCAQVPQDAKAEPEPKPEFEDMADIEVEKGFKMSRVCDRLIDVFLVERTKPEDWRILITFSKEWDLIRPYFFQRCESQAKAADDPKKKADLLKLARLMKEVHEYAKSC